MITAPFNFAPLSEKVFFPKWSEWVSHDIPFKDGESGEIEISITAESPIFIRDHEDERKFCNFNGKYYIPGSSLKGMLRNVLEIMSFSRISFIDDQTYAVRDLNNKELYRDKFHPMQIFCGWLRKDEGRYFIDDCGQPGRISHKDIDRLLGIDFSSKFSRDFGGTEREKTAIYKYEIVGWNIEHTFKHKRKNSQQQKVYGSINTPGDGEIKKGTLVFTGQPTKRKNNGKMGDGKGFEFVFFDTEDVLEVPDNVFEKFKFAYFDGRTTQPKESEDWKYWKKRLEEGRRVPVFFRKTKGGAVESFGLSMLFKLPYRHSVLDGLPPEHIKLAPVSDMAETIFGMVDELGEDALRGRVHVSHALANIGVMEDREYILTLGTPRPSYYPIYIEQKNRSRMYATYMDNNFKIRGWKRYPVHRNFTAPGNEAPSKVTTRFVPLKKGVRFFAKIRYHNLKPEEIGALLSALTFHGTENCFHSIGLAKPYGFGKIKAEVTGGTSTQDKGKKTVTFDKATTREYMKKFECLMRKVVGNWCRSDQVKELLTMASDQENRSGTQSALKYLELKAFARNKNISNGSLSRNNYLPSYSSLPGVSPRYPQSLLEKNECTHDAAEEFPAGEIYRLDREYVSKYASGKQRLLELFKRKYPDMDEDFGDLTKRDSGEKNWDKIEQIYRSVVASKSSSEIERFIEKNSLSSWAEEAKKELEVIKEKEKEERLRKEMESAWKSIEESGVKEDFEEYIRKYPQSPHTHEAQNRVEKFVIEEKKKIEREEKAKKAAKKAKNRSKALGMVINLNKGSKKNKKKK